ncbi:MAG: hypothetical protein QOD13_1931 [Thermoleophilaceae bacterium]|jgi:hypothetical protein|nr:hypothetical protein [Thermoleophilaceae bacterium]
MPAPGFTAEAALSHPRRGYGGLSGSRASSTRLLTPQEVWEHCSEDGQLCYFCDEGPDGCGCDWYYGDYYLASSDCGSDWR